MSASLALRTVNFDEITAFLEEKHMIDVYDVNGTQHGNGPYTYDGWLKRNGLKRSDGGGSIETQQDYWRRYSADPEGKAKEPPYFNFWHWLLKGIGAAADPEWTTLEDCHWRTFRLSRDADLVKPPTESELRKKALIMQMQKQMGGSLNNISEGYNEVPRILDLLFAEYGDEFDVYMHVDR